MKNQKNNSAAPALQKQIDQIAEKNKLNRLCPICDNLQEWVEKEKIIAAPSVEDETAKIKGAIKNGSYLSFKNPWQ